VNNETKEIKKKRVFWVDHDRFDLKPDKSTWLEVSDVLTDRGYDVTILTGHGITKYFPRQHKVRLQYHSAFDVGLIFRISLLFNILVWLIRNSSRQDIVMLHPAGLIIAPFLRLFRRDRIHLDVRTVPVEIHNLKDKLDRLFYWKFSMRFFHKVARGYSFITLRLKDDVESEFKTKFNDFIIWQSGVNVERFIVKRLSVSNKNDKDFVLFYHGTISPNRGIDRVIEGISQVDERYRRHINFVIVGAGSALKDLELLVSRNGLGEVITFKGLVSYERIGYEIANSDCCICPLPTRREWDISSPIKVFEYMAAGKPMILTPINAHKDVAKGQEYVVWTKGDKAEHFKNAIEYAYENRIKLKKASCEARKFVKERYDWSIQGRRLAEYFGVKFG
jgi:glycosyltransferase involved in cell wall biosynthesis